MEYCRIADLQLLSRPSNFWKYFWTRDEALSWNIKHLFDKISSQGFSDQMAYTTFLFFSKVPE